MRKELAEATSRSERSSPSLGPQSDDDLLTVAGSPSLSAKGLSPESPSSSNVELPMETIPVQTAPTPDSDESRKDR